MLVVAVTGALTFEVVALHATGETLATADCGDVDPLALHQGVDRDLLADLEPVDRIETKKMIKAALHSALSDRAADGKVLVIDSWNFDAPKTKIAKKLLTALGVEGKALVVVDIGDTNTIKSFLNLPEVQLIEQRELNAYDVLCSDYVVFSHATLPGGGEVVEGAPKKKAAAKKAAPAKKAAAKEEPPQADEPVAKTVPTGAVEATEGGDVPEGYEIKGNAQSMLYHVPGSPFYERTVPEYWFATAEDAEAAGFQLPPSQRDKEEEQS